MKNISEIFYKCLSLKTLPNIENWNTKNVENIYEIFSKCYSLSSLPKISKWKIKTDKIIDEQKSLKMKEIKEFNFKEANLEERKKIFLKLKEIYPDKIPIIIKQKKGSAYNKLLQKNEILKFLMEENETIGYLKNRIRIRLGNSEFFCLNINGKYLQYEVYINYVYEKYKSQDGI